MSVSSSFMRQPVNVSGKLANAFIVYDQKANTPGVYDPVDNFQGINISNYSDNFAKATITLKDLQGVQTAHDMLLLPNSSESYGFQGKFIDKFEVFAVEEPVVAGVNEPSSLVAAPTAKAGLVDINLIEE